MLWDMKWNIIGRRDSILYVQYSIYVFYENNEFKGPYRNKLRDM